MKKLIAILVTLAALAAIFYVASASGLLPEGVQEFYNDCGYVCYVWPDGSGDCYPCVLCNTVVVTEEPKDGPKDTPVPPTEEPSLPPPPEPTEKPKCNRGLGNGSENCDPGNSYGQGIGQGRQAGEDRNENKKDK